MRADTMTIEHPITGISPSSDDRDEAVERVLEFVGVQPADLIQLEHDVALRDAAIQFGAALQAHVPAGDHRERAWGLLEDAYLRATHGITQRTPEA